MSYAFPWAHLMADFKFHDQPALVSFFADLLRATPWVEPALDAADLLLPMPLSRQRLQVRGYNQALLLAQQLNAAQNPRQTSCCALPTRRPSTPSSARSG